MKKKTARGFTPIALFSTTKSAKGFTLIEILIVIGIIAILAAVVLIAINPARQFAQANNSQRTSNVNAILNAIGQYIADNKGTLPPGIPTDPNPALEIKKAGGVDLCSVLVPTYLPALPVDPTVTAGAVTDCLGAYSTGYFVVASSSRVTVSAPSTQLPATTAVSVTR